MEQALHIFAFLEKNPKLTLYMDPSDPDMAYDALFTKKASTFKEYYQGAE